MGIGLPQRHALGAEKCDWLIQGSRGPINIRGWNNMGRTGATERIKHSEALFDPQFFVFGHTWLCLLES